MAAEWEPAGHSMHDVDPLAVEYAPAGHSMHDADPGTAENVPTGQRLGTALPAAAEYCPGEQGVQMVAAPPGENVPAGHNIYQGWWGHTHTHKEQKKGEGLAWALGGECVPQCSQKPLACIVQVLTMAPVTLSHA